jgi:hypothetical protein
MGGVIGCGENVWDVVGVKNTCEAVWWGLRRGVEGECKDCKLLLVKGLTK